MSQPLAEHVQWLIGALTPGAARHDSFEVERHVGVAGADAAELGRILHDLAGSRRALASLVRVGELATGEVVIDYCATDGTPGKVVAAPSHDGRLDAPTFS